MNGKSIEENLAIMNTDEGEGVLMTADEAFENGFVGEVIELKGFKNINKQVFYNCGYTEKQVNKLINNQKSNKMKNPFKKTVPQKAVKVDDNQILYRELATGEGVEILGSTDAFTGSFEVDNYVVNVVENSITEVKEVDGRAKEIEALKNEISSLKSANKELEKSVVEIVADAKAEIDSIKAVLEAAKLSKSSPNLPVGEFKDDKKAEASSSPANIEYMRELRKRKGGE
jgi:hypothetical protein